MKRINVGVSIFATGTAHIWNNGLNQNLAFLVQLLRQIPWVGQVWLLNGGDAQKLPGTLEFEDLGAPLVQPNDVTHDIDLVIEMGATLPLEWLRHVHALGAKLVTLLVGHTYLGQSEAPVFGRNGTAFNASPWDAIWTLPSFMKTSAPMLRTICRAPVHAVPHIWSPLFLERQVAQLKDPGRRFGFDPQRTGRAPGWRLAIFEPNISVGKNCFIPMLVCDRAYRLEREAVSFMMVLNSFHMKEHLTFNRLASHLDLTRDSKASYEPRLGFADCMATNAIDAVVAHQWEWGLNYLYYDALHGGYPLVHNSEYLQVAGVGLYYPGFEAERGAQVLLQARREGAEYWADYRARATAFLQQLAPLRPANVDSYAALIAPLMGDRLGSA